VIVLGISETHCATAAVLRAVIKAQQACYRFSKNRIR